MKSQIKLMGSLIAKDAEKGTWEHNRTSKRVYSVFGICPTLNGLGHEGNEPMIIVIYDGDRDKTDRQYNADKDKGQSKSGQSL